MEMSKLRWKTGDSGERLMENTTAEGRLRSNDVSRGKEREKSEGGLTP